MKSTAANIAGYVKGAIIQQEEVHLRAVSSYS
jgi:hypothetical protein